MSEIYQGQSGNIYTVEDTPLASGGEGYIYSIQENSNLVLKIFKSDRRTKAREEKLLKMVKYQLNRQQLEQVTWPQDVVYNKEGFAGYVMPRLRENRNLNVVYSSQSGNQDLRHRMLIAYNLCAAVDTVHSINQVCGDLNPQNICVNLNLRSETALQVTLVDTDSYHISDESRTYRCEVGQAQYLAPEIQKKLASGADLKSAYLPTYTKETDLFALAVHIFALLMNGCHPFACAKQMGSGYENTMEAMGEAAESVVLPQPVENIRDGFFPFHQKRKGITYPLYAPDFKTLPIELQQMFIRAFEKGYSNPEERPDANAWMDVLRKIQSSPFGKCEKGHYYFGNSGCGYCEAKVRMLRMMQGGFDIPKQQTKQEEQKEQSQQGQNKQQAWKEPQTQQTTQRANVGTSGSGVRSVGSMFGTENSVNTGKASKPKKLWMILGIAMVVYVAFERVMYWDDAPDRSTTSQAEVQAESSVQKQEEVQAEVQTQLQGEKVEERSEAQTELQIETVEENERALEKETLEEIILAIRDRRYEDVYEKMKEFCLYDDLYALVNDDGGFYYADGQFYTTFSDGYALYMNIEWEEYLQYGEFVNGHLEGEGIEIGSDPVWEDVYYYVSGSFSDSYANGECTYFVSVVPNKEEDYEMTIEGNFADGYEDGAMERKIVYLESGEEQFYTYTANAGEYEVLREEDGEYVYMENDEYYWSTGYMDFLKDNGTPRRK